jgi:inhibitor of the pro-sigma K processing machinery
MQQNQAAGILATAVVITLLVVIFIRSPLRRVAKVLLNTALGFLVMQGLNYVGLGIAINWLTTLLAGIFGLPGLVLVVLLQKIFV